MSRALVVALAIALSAVAIPAVNASAAPADHSCIDTNHNGSCDPGEPALAPLVDANGALNVGSAMSCSTTSSFPTWAR